MRNETRVLFNAYLSEIAKLNAVPAVTEKFAVAPSVQQKLESKIQESSTFLKSINVIPVQEQSGSKLGLGIGGPIASTTDTKTKDRSPVQPTTMDENGYVCAQINSDTAIPYALLDAWSIFPDFQTRIRDLIIQRQALDRIVIGFNGTSRAATSDREANPLLQDVGKGWLQKLREQAAARVLKETTAGSGKVTVGSTGAYKNLDALVLDAINDLLDPWHTEAPDLVAICGRGLLQDKYFPLVNQAQPNTETLAADVIMSQKRIGGVPAVTVPYFPANKVLITSLSNLSVYYQNGARRRTIVDNAKRDQIENYESSNDDYVVEDLGKAALIENITAV
jgi:P2 family phage major capsid protein